MSHGIGGLERNNKEPKRKFQRKKPNTFCIVKGNLKIKEYYTALDI
jgi:hypothetical protein